MRIAQISPLAESVPPEKYGGTERVVSVLTEGLVKRGHEVTLFATGDSQTSAKLFSVFQKALRKAQVQNTYGPNIWSLLNSGIAYQLQDQFDIIHDHCSQNTPVSLPLANVSKTPVVMTLHGSLKNREDTRAFAFYTKPSLVSISYAQRKGWEHLNYGANIYHGLPMKDYPFSVSNDGYLLFVGRIHVENGMDEKGLLHAISIAEKVKLPLLIAAKLDALNQTDIAYFSRVIKPHLSNQIQWLGEVDEKTRNVLMSKALCLLHTINFAEPFGLTLIEAMACGCPVIAFRKGSIPEIIKNGESGFIVENEEEAIEAIKEIKTIDRLYCQSYALNSFSAEKMIDAYEELYQQILLGHQLKENVQI